MTKKTKRGGRVKDASDPPDPIDVYVGSRLRMRRDLMNITQDDLGKMLGVTFQQVQKYERGANRVSASRLFQLGQILNVDINFFFSGYTGNEPGKKPKGFSESKQENFTWLEEPGGDLMKQKETLDLVRIYYQVRDGGIRKQYLKILAALVASQG